MCSAAMLQVAFLVLLAVASASTVIDDQGTSQLGAADIEGVLFDYTPTLDGVRFLSKIVVCEHLFVPFFLAFFLFRVSLTLSLSAFFSSIVSQQNIPIWSLI